MTFRFCPYLLRDIQIGTAFTNYYWEAFKKGLSREKADREEIGGEIEILGKNLHTPKPRFNVAFTYLLIHNSTFSSSDLVSN